MTLDKFRSCLEKIKTDNAESVKEALTCFIDCYRDYLPQFPQGHKTKKLYDCPSDRPEWLLGHRKVVSYEGLYYTDLTFIGANPIEFFIDPLMAIGHTWLYSTQRPSDYPKSSTLADLLLAQGWNTIPALPAARMGAFYECTDGNHRLYAAYLLGRKVLVSCNYEYRSVYDSSGNRIQLAKRL